MAANFDVFVDEVHSKLPTLCYLPTLHTILYKSRFIAYSSYCIKLFLKMFKNIAKQFMRGMVNI